MKIIVIATFSLITLFLLAGFHQNQKPSKNSVIKSSSPFTPNTLKPILADHFNFPVGQPDGNGYYNAQPFGNNNHLGDDWNGKGGGNTDLGDTIYAVANGYVSHAKDINGGWGNVIRITHYLPNNTTVESLYAHCDTILIDSAVFVSIGTAIGTIGTAHGKYPAHLHFEMRSEINLPIGGGYGYSTNGYLNPTNFINQHR